MNGIRDRANRRGITRLCHFTPSRNLAHIASDPRGILASRHLRDDESAILNPTDRERLDGYPGHVCCSIQYPNAWYFRKARENERLFRDWVVLLIEPHYLWQSGTLFCPRNAAADRGRLVRPGGAAFDALFADVVEGFRTYRREPTHPDFLPTDEQAEVLIPDQIDHGDVMGVAVWDDGQAAREASRLELQGLRIPRIVIAPSFFAPRALSQELRSGKMPSERGYDGGGANA